MHHPTKEKLIATVVEMLDVRPQDVGIEEILKTSGVSTGSMYHHFQDVDHLVETAYARRFSAAVDANITLITELLGQADSRESMLEQLAEVTRISQSPERSSTRYERARIVAMAQQNERFRSELRVEQERLTDALADHFREMQEKGWMNKEFNPRVASVFIQAYTLGKVVDDFAAKPVDPEEWNAVIGSVVEKVFAA